MVKQKDIPSPAKKRELLLQALYQKEISGVSNTEVLKQLKERNKKYDLSDLNLILKGIKQNKQTIDKMIEQNSKLKLKDIGEIELSILRSMLFEMQQKTVDRSISLSEAIRLAKKYGQDSSYKFINAILDKFEN
ncbi:MAG: transcription antitermination factor NusB [Pseudomonadota bacterium]|nr:transcription antitermination factor NusB [Pseudomonadota bacterium]MEC7787131.1 transcription antitermination factor NusB [Pseudomonadota bacterium]MEC8108761.1 transcription antitermination factor NusB [Pseudomonadota bacterium]MEC8168972.1 transcription antitermination factor NusB [Pseudomonadota bacterium]